MLASWHDVSRTDFFKKNGGSLNFPRVDVDQQNSRAMRIAPLHRLTTRTSDSLVRARSTMSMSAFFPPAVVAALPPHWVSWLDAALKLGDERVRDWPLMNPFHVLAVVAVYFTVIGVLVLLTKSNVLKKWEGKGIILIHNFNLFALSLYMLVECVRQAVNNNYTLFGNSIDRTANGLGVRVTAA